MVLGFMRRVSRSGSEGSMNFCDHMQLEEHSPWTRSVMHFTRDGIVRLMNAMLLKGKFDCVEQSIRHNPPVAIGRTLAHGANDSCGPQIFFFAGPGHLESLQKASSEKNRTRILSNRFTTDRLSRVKRWYASYTDSGKPFLPLDLPSSHRVRLGEAVFYWFFSKT
jgi:hypothetical protein